MTRRILLHPWRMRRWLVHPKQVVRIIQRERSNKEYEKREGHPYYGPIPPDSWPQPIPDGFGQIFRCIECGELGYFGSKTSAYEAGCSGCGSTVGVTVGSYGTFPTWEAKKRRWQCTGMTSVLKSCSS